MKFHNRHHTSKQPQKLYLFLGILIYRLFPDGSKPTLKIAHAVVMISVFILTVIALIAVFDFHNLKSIPNMYSFHSYVGLLTVILFSFQVSIIKLV